MNRFSSQIHVSKTCFPLLSFKVPAEEMRKSASTLYQFNISDPTLLFRNACENLRRLLTQTHCQIDRERND